MVKKKPGEQKKVIKKRNLKIIPPPPISKKSPKYADHPPPNAGHGFAALDVRDQEHFHRVKYSISTVIEIQNNVNCEV